MTSIFFNFSQVIVCIALLFSLIYCTVDTETARFTGGTELGLKLTGLLRADIFVHALCEVHGLSKICPEIVCWPRIIFKLWSADVGWLTLFLYFFYCYDPYMIVKLQVFLYACAGKYSTLVAFDRCTIWKTKYCFHFDLFTQNTKL